MKTAVDHASHGCSAMLWVVLFLVAVLGMGCSPRDATSTDSTGGAEQVTEPAENAGQDNPHELTPQEQRGKTIYLTGTGSSGNAITATLGDQGVKVPASVLKCVNCHGFDGIGKPEGGIIPSTITWQELTKPLGPTHPSSRQRPPYTERLLKRSITRGLDPAGDELDGAMPLYQMTIEDLDDLISYIKKLGYDRDPGLTDDTLRIGTILAPAEQLADMHAAVKALLTAYFADLNQRGGIYGRQVELQFCESPGPLDERAVAARTFVQQQQPFALVAPFLAGADQAIAALAAEQKLPMIGPITLHPQIDFPLNRFVFYLFAGLSDQGQALAVFAGEKFADRSPPTAVVLLADDDRSRIVAEAIRNRCERIGWNEPQLKVVDPDRFATDQIVQQWSHQQVDVVFFLLGEERDLPFLQQADKLDWHPLVLIPGSLTSRNFLQAPAGFNDRLFLSFPTLPRDQTPAGVAEYGQLAVDHRLPAAHLSSQMAALASAKILVAALNKVGKDASREKLIDQLETTFKQQSALTPPITFGPNRRIGAKGAYIVAVDLQQRKLRPIGDWVDVGR